MARRSPKRKSKRDGLDVEAEEWHGEVQKGSQSVTDWTLKRSEERMKSKKEGHSVTDWTLRWSEHGRSPK